MVMMMKEKVCMQCVLDGRTANEECIYKAGERREDYTTRRGEISLLEGEGLVPDDEVDAFALLELDRLVDVRAQVDQRRPDLVVHLPTHIDLDVSGRS